MRTDIEDRIYTYIYIYVGVYLGYIWGIKVFVFPVYKGDGLDSVLTFFCVMRFLPFFLAFREIYIYRSDDDYCVMG